MEKWVIEARSVFLESVRAFFAKKDYLETLTSNLVPTPGTEVHLRYFQTEWIDHQRKSHRLYLRSSPELHMKKLLAAGAERIFQIAPCYRNVGEMSAWHRPEFLMLEFYQTGISPDQFIQETFEFMKATANTLKARKKSDWKADILELPNSFQKFSIVEAFKTFAQIDLKDQDASLAGKAIHAGVMSVQASDDFETAFFKILLEKIEPEIAKIPIALLYDYPPSQAALARVEGGVAKRFEFYVHGVELSNGFYELLDQKSNEQRFKASIQRRKELGYEVFELDPAFVSALKKGLPECCGNALGLDRWFALVLGKQDLSFLD